MDLKHGTIYGLLTLAVILTGSLPFRGHDVAKLRPVKILLAAYDQGQVTLTADTGDQGTGDTWQGAMTDMEKAASGVIFQGTVTYILLEDETMLPTVLENDALNPNCMVCLTEGEPELTEVGAYLDAHSPESSLRQLRAGRVDVLPRLQCRDGRYDLENGNG